VVFPGNPQGRHIRESGEKGCVLTTIGPGGSVAQAFHRLDVVRWERSRVDATEISTDADLLDRISSVLDDLLLSESDPEKLLAVRVIIEGVAPMHDRLHAEAERYVAEVRNLALERGSDRLWIEKVEFQTRRGRSSALPDGPIEELQEVLDELRADPAALAALGEELGELKRKLPAELTTGPDAPRPGDPEWMLGVLEEVQPLLLDLLRNADHGAES
jgi:DNA repair protein SbcD/Mre11